MTEASDIIVGVERAKMGTKVFITFQKNHPDCTHTLVISFLGQDQDRAENLGSSYLWEIPDYTVKCSGHTNVQCYLTAKTYLNGEYLGSRNTLLTLEVPDPVKVEAQKLVLGQSAALACRGRAENYAMDLVLMMGTRGFSIAAGVRSDTVRWAPPYDPAKLFPAQVQGEGVIRCTTWNGSAKVGETDTKVLLEVPQNPVTRPVFRSVVIKPRGNSLPSPFDKLYIRGKTGITAAVKADSPYSEIESVTMKIGPREVSGSPLEIPVLGSSGHQRVVVTATDQRGFSVIWAQYIDIVSYQQPRVVPLEGRADILCDRANDAGQLTPGGTFLAIGAGRKYTQIRYRGQIINHCILRYRYKKTEDVSFGPWIPLLEESSPQREISALLKGVVEDPQRSYRIQLSAADTLGEEHILSFTVMTQAVSFVLYDGVDGAAFGKYPEEAHVVDLAPHMTLRVRGKLELLGERWRDLGLSSAVETSVYPHGRYEDTGCSYRVTGDKRVCISFNCAFSYGNLPVQVSLNAVPEGLRPGRPVSVYCPSELGAALVTVGPEGLVRVDSLPKAGYCGWIDGYLEYFL